MTTDSVSECETCDLPERRPSRGGNRVTLITVRGMRFGHGTVIDPEVRVRRRRPGGSTGRTVTERCARLKCDCGTIYLAPLKDLFRTGKARKSCGQDCKAKGRDYRAWRRYFRIAAQIAAGAFCTDEDKLRLAAEATERGEFIGCEIPEAARDH